MSKRVTYSKVANGIEVVLTIEQDGKVIELSAIGMENLLSNINGLSRVKSDSKQDTAGLISAAASTFKERNLKYKDNKDNVGAVMVGMFPNGVKLSTKEDFTKWHLFELMVVKMTRFANSNLAHQDSIHDLGIYSFMVEKEVITNG